MKLIIDMNLSPLWVEALEAAGISAAHWVSIGDPQATDEEIFRWASTNGAVLFTHDLDFGRLLALTGAGGPSVVQLRTHELLPSRIGEIVVAALGQHHEALERGALVVIDTDLARARVLPIRRR